MLKSATRSSSTKILASVVLVAGAASVAGLGTFGAFTSTTNASESVSTETVQIALASGVALDTSVAVPKLVPGDTVQRAVTLTRSAATDSFGSVMLTTTASDTNKLTTDGTNGLKLVVDQCSVPWTANVAAKTLTCSGTTTNVVASRAVVGTNLDLGAATTALNATGAASNLKLTLTLPTEANNDFQGLSNTINFKFDATQRAAGSK